MQWTMTPTLVAKTFIELLKIRFSNAMDHGKKFLAAMFSVIVYLSSIKVIQNTQNFGSKHVVFNQRVISM